MNKQKKVLLADDTKLFLELEKTFLQRTSVDILIAHNGKQALELARQHHPDIAILDLNMPEMDGDECCRAIKQDLDLQGTKVLMVTTKGRTQDQERCREAGCDEMLFKPINRAEFLATVEKLLQIPTRNERYQAKIIVEYGVNAETTLTEYSIDISSGGLYIRTDSPLEEGDLLFLRFSVSSDSKEIICRAKVAWVNPPTKLKKLDRPPGMGVQFFDISLDELRTIRDFMESNQLEPTW